MQQNKPSGMSVVVLAALLVLLAQSQAQAYIGPGAGFAVGTTVVAFFVAFLSAIGAFFLWPVRWLFRFFRGRKARKRARIKRYVVLGLDGMEPSLTEKFMAEGKLPNLARLKEQGTFMRLQTSAPPLSPVAWSTFLTGCNPGKHNSFDFLTRDKRNYLPLLSSVSIKTLSKIWRFGPIKVPVRKPEIRLLRKGKPFWHVLGEHGVFSNIIRVPITWPPESFRGVLLSAMCVPDLRGTQGTFSYYSTAAIDEEHIGGEQIRVQRNRQRIRSHLIGPEGGKGKGPLKCPFDIELNGKDQAILRVCGKRYELQKGQYTPWIKVEFKAGRFTRIRGICEFLLLETEPEFKLYVMPIQIDPEKPAMPISHPLVYSTYLAKKHGTYATLGLAEDTWALNAKLIGDDDFLHQCLEADGEREKMFFDALDKVRHGAVACVFDGMDRIQHMFWRYIDPEHPAHAGQAEQQHRNAIEELYRRSDELVGRTMEACDDDGTVLMVISDHGFNSFRYGLDLNYWLEQNGYLALKPGGRGKKYLAGIDWSRTKAYSMGLAGIWLNVKGREAQGIVEPSEADALRDELCEKLTGLMNEERGEVAIHRALNSHRIYNGPYKAEAPDLIIGYNRNYRVCWEAAIGQPTHRLFHNNTKAWSGDHCIDPQLIPGVMFCNRKIKTDKPRLMDVGVTALDLFGVEVPKFMDGRPLEVANADGEFPSDEEPRAEREASPTSREEALVEAAR